MQLKHTKGPWVKDYGQTKGHIKTLCNPEVHTKTVIKYRYDLCEETLTEDEIEANARLISCAPEMLEMLMIVREYCDYNFITTEWINDLDKLIERATGLKIGEVLS